MVGQSSFIRDLKPTKYDIIPIGLIAVDGISRGALQSYHKDNSIFEKRFGASKFGFWGSQSWQRNYQGNKYQNSDGSINPHKKEYFGNYGRDFYHTFDDHTKISGRLASGVFSIGAVIDIKNKDKNVFAVASKGIVIWLIGSLLEKTTYQMLSYH